MRSAGNRLVRTRVQPPQAHRRRARRVKKCHVHRSFTVTDDDPGGRPGGRGDGRRDKNE